MIKYCRLCLKNDCPMANIITLKLKNSDLDLVDSLYWIFGVEIDVNDVYSKLICERCESVIQNVGYLREAFQKNQLILKNKRKELERVFISKLDDLGLNSTSHKVPVVSITKLENTNEFDEYEKISDLQFKKKIGTSQIDHCISIEKRNVPDSTEIVKKLAVPLVSINKLGNISADKNNEKIGGIIYKKKISTEQGKQTRSIGTSTEPENKNENLSQTRRRTGVKKDNRVKVSMDVLRNCMSPSLPLHKLEDSHVCEEYEKIGDITYRQIRSNFDVNPDVMREEIKKLAFIEYYYSIPTTALQELIKDRNDELNGKKKYKASLITQSSSNNNEPLIKIHNVFHVEVCTYCSKAFNSKKMLNFHCRIYHRKEMDMTGVQRIVNHRRKRNVKRKKIHRKNVLPVSNPLDREMINHGDLDLKQNMPRLNNCRQENVLIPNRALTKVKHRLNGIKGLLGIQKNNFPNLKFMKEQSKDSNNLILNKSQTVLSQNTTNLTESTQSTGSSKASHNSSNLTKSNQCFEIQPQMDTTPSVPVQVTEMHVDGIEHHIETSPDYRSKEVTAEKIGAETENIENMTSDDDQNLSPEENNKLENIPTHENECQPQQCTESSRLKKQNLQSITGSNNLISLQQLKNRLREKIKEHHLESPQKQTVTASRNSISLQQVKKGKRRSKMHNITGSINSICLQQQLIINCDRPKPRNSLLEDPQRQSIENITASTKSVSLQQMEVDRDRPEIDNITGSNNLICSQQLNISSDRPEPENGRLEDPQKQNVASRNSVSLQVKIDRDISIVHEITESSDSICSQQQISSDISEPENCHLEDPQEQNIQNITSRNSGSLYAEKSNENRPKILSTTSSNLISSEQQISSDSPLVNIHQQRKIGPKNLSYLKGMADKIKKITRILSNRNNPVEKQIELSIGDTTELTDSVRPAQDDTQEETLRDNSSAAQVTDKPTSTEVVADICDISEKDVTQHIDLQEIDHKSETTTNTLPRGGKKIENTSENSEQLNEKEETVESYHDKLKHVLKLKEKYKAINNRLVTIQSNNSHPTGSSVTRKVKLKNKTRNIPQVEKQLLKENVTEISNLMSSIKISVNKEVTNIDKHLNDSDSQLKTSSNVENNTAKRKSSDDNHQLEQLTQTEPSTHPKKLRKLNMMVVNTTDLTELQPASLNDSVQEQEVDSNLTSPSVSYDILQFPPNSRKDSEI